ncbi:MAG TPA: hypothetical protein VGP96_03820 [Candidatus Dormibacteraeota bacterium]|jgi:hypothetical protein|nr:hypothetical protein [Candidatus Dormibacteraeota bacterium]
MRGAPLAVVTVLVLVGAACGGGPSTAHGTPSTAATVGSTTARSTTATVSFGSPVPATPTARVAAPPQPTSAAAPAARSPAPTSPPGPCTPGDVSITTSTDLRHYSSGQIANVKVVVHNLSGNGCLFTAPGDFAIEPDPSGAAVYAVHLGCPAAGCEPLAPQVGTLTYPVPWNQMTNQGQYANQQAPNGAYHARAAFTGYPVSTSAPFTIG